MVSVSDIDCVHANLEPVIVSMCMALGTLEDCVQFGLGSATRSGSESDADFSMAKEEKQSSLANLIMTWQYTMTTPILAKDAIQALLIMWGAMADTEVFRHHPATLIRSWILEQTRQIFRNYPVTVNTVDAEFMDRESGILFGSPERTEKGNSLPLRHIDSG